MNGEYEMLTKEQKETMIAELRGKREAKEKPRNTKRTWTWLSAKKSK